MASARQQNKQLKSKITHNAAENGGNDNANSSTTNVNGKTASVNKKILLLGDSHVRRLNDCKLLPDSIVAKGIGGHRSNQIISCHKQTINSELTTTDEVIIDIGSNDVSKGIKQEKIVENVHSARKQLRDINPDIKISVSSVFLQGYDTPKNTRVIEINRALKHLCLNEGWEYIDHGNIAFRHLDKGGMHLTPDGNKLFARNVIGHVQSG